MAKKVREPEDSDDMDDEMPDFNDSEDFTDDIPDEELMPELMAQRPDETDGVESVIIVDGIPEVGIDRIEKLKAVIRKVFGKYGKVVNEHYPVDKDKTKGYAFLEFGSPKMAQEAVKNTNNYKLDKQHTFLCNLFSDFDKYCSIPEEWDPPKEEDYQDQGNLKQWLLDPEANDQFSILHEGGDKVSIFANTKSDPVELKSRQRWTETYVKWSPLGTYLVTCHAKGIALWGGKDFEKVQKYNHSGVQFVDFSPCEQYIVTFAPQPNDPNSAIIIWETRSGAQKRAFRADGPPNVAMFKWSHDGKYFARMSAESTLSIFETPSFGMLDKKSIKVSGMRDFSWSPGENVLAYWVAEDKDVPARVTLLEVPSRNEVRVKNLFNVADCKMHWQKGGDYLCVKVDRYNKILRVPRADDPASKYAGLYYNFEIFHMREKQIPVDSVEIKENVHAFAWEPVGSKFALIHGESVQSLNVSFYDVKQGQSPSLLKKYERKSADCLFWSPAGQFIVLAGLRGNMNGVLEFVDTSDFTVMNTGEHFMCSEVQWDPTGRYLTTGVSFWAHKVDNAYWIWSFQGKILIKAHSEKFCQFRWRPRPPTRLSKKHIKDIRKNLISYSKEFSEVDKIRHTKASKELMDKRKAKYDEFVEYRDNRKEALAAQSQAWALLRTEAAEEDYESREEEVVEFLVKEESSIVD